MADINFKTIYYSDATIPSVEIATIENHTFLLERTMSFFHAVLKIDGKIIKSVTSLEEAIALCNEFLENRKLT